MAKKLWNKDYILLLQGNAISTVGDLMYSVAIGFWVYQKTGSSALMGVMTSISMFVTMFLSPFCGSIVDKCNRKWVMVGIDTLQGVLMLDIIPRDDMVRGQPLRSKNGLTKISCYSPLSVL